MSERFKVVCIPCRALDKCFAVPFIFSSQSTSWSTWSTYRHCNYLKFTVSGMFISLGCVNCPVAFWLTGGGGDVASAFIN